VIWELAALFFSPQILLYQLVKEPYFQPKLTPAVRNPIGQAAIERFRNFFNWFIACDVSG